MVAEVALLPRQSGLPKVHLMPQLLMQKSVNNSVSQLPITKVYLLSWLLNPKKATVGARIPDHRITQAIVAELGEPLLSSTLILPGEDEPMSEGWIINDQLGNAVDIVVDGPVGEDGPTTVIDLSSGEAMIERVGAGDISMFDV